LGTNRVHYVTVGKGPTTFVFIHGWACNNAFWREQIPALTDKARLVLVDLPGHGQSDAPSTRYTMDYFASAVRAVMDDAGVDRAVLVGHSMGVPVICRVYAQDPGRVAGLVAVDGVLHRPDLPPERQEGMAQFAASLRGGEYREPLREFINAMFTSPDSTAVRDWVYEEAVRTPQQVMVSAMECMFDPTEPNWDLKRVDFPVLAIHAPSPMWTEEYETFVQGLSDQADYRTIDGVGHFLMMEKHVEFTVTLIEMLLECGLMTD
jgi:pimeloyl-ACP methyl ester carboxylesterase